MPPPPRYSTPRPAPEPEPARPAPRPLSEEKAWPPKRPQENQKRQGTEWANRTPPADRVWPPPKPKSPPPPISPPLDLGGLSKLQDFVEEAHATNLSARLKLSARNLARGVTARVLPRRGFVKGVAERWTEVHMGKRSDDQWGGYSGFAPDSPEHGSPTLELSPERVGPLSFERRRTLVAEHIENLTPLQQL
jgi:hypothetical protein